MLYNTIMTKKKKIIISVSVVSAVVLIVTAILLLVFLLKPKRANEVTINASDYQILVETQRAEGERTYRFKFVTAGQTKEISSDSHILDITPYLWDDTLHLGSEYQVSVCLVEKAGVLAGDYGKSTTFTPKIRLHSPGEIKYDAQANLISWDEVKGADGYEVRYIDKGETEKLPTTSTNMDLALIMGGERNIYVVAVSNRDGLLESDSSTIHLTLDHEIAEITSAVINNQKYLVLKSKDKIKQVILKSQSEPKEVILSLSLSELQENGVYILKYDVRQLKLSSPLTVTVVTDSHNTYSYADTNVVIE